MGRSGRAQAHIRDGVDPGGRGRTKRRRDVEQA